MNLLGIDFEEWFHPQLIQDVLKHETKSFEITATIVATVIADDATCTSDEFPYLFVASLAVGNIILCYFSPIALYFM